MKKKWLLLIALMVLVLVAACGDNSNDEVNNETAKANLENLNTEGMPIVEETIEIEIFAPNRFPSQDFNDILLWNEYRDLTNIDVKWENVPVDNLAEKKNIKLAGGDYPDAFFGNSFTATDLINHGQEGDIIVLNDLIDEYAPNFKKLLEEYPEVEKALRMPDGNIYSLPSLLDPEFESVLIGSMLWYKEDVLEELGTDIPKTTDELYEYLKLVQENYPDMEPFGGRPGFGYPIIPHFKGAWGLNNRGRTHADVDMDPETDELRFIPADENYKDMLEYLNKLYDEGLMDEEFFTGDNDQLVAKGSRGVFAVLPDHNPESVYTGLDNYVGGEALEGPNGDHLYTNVQSPVGRIGEFVITAENPYPEATVRWADHLYSDEGSRLFYMGVEGVTYEVEEDGTLEFVEEITDNPDGMTQDEALGQYLTYAGAGSAGIIRQEYFKGSEGIPSSLETADKLSPYFPEEVWAPFNYTIEELDEMTILQTDIDTYISEMLVKFITGRESFDDWDKYVEEFDKMGLERYMEIYNDAYGRYSAE